MGCLAWINHKGSHVSYAWRTERNWHLRSLMCLNLLNRILVTPGFVAFSCLGHTSQWHVGLVGHIRMYLQGICQFERVLSILIKGTLAVCVNYDVSVISAFQIKILHGNFVQRLHTTDVVSVVSDHIHKYWILYVKRTVPLYTTVHTELIGIGSIGYLLQ